MFEVVAPVRCLFLVGYAPIDVFVARNGRMFYSSVNIPGHENSNYRFVQFGHQLSQH